MGKYYRLGASTAFSPDFNNYQHTPGPGNSQDQHKKFLRDDSEECGFYSETTGESSHYFKECSYTNGFAFEKDYSVYLETNRLGGDEDRAREIEFHLIGII